MTAPLIMAAAMLIEVTVGWPRCVFDRIRHPVVWIGSLITALDNTLNRDHRNNRSGVVRRVLGLLTMLVVVSTTVACAVAIDTRLPDTPLGDVVTALVASSLIATRSLYVHVAAVAKPLAGNDIEAARSAVSHIVGRDPSRLDSAAIARASLESLAENASDGVVAPVFWGAVFGLPGIAAYKAVNTLDSMLGHRCPRYADFGWASARLDDLANLVPARLTAAFIAAAGRTVPAVSTALTDASLHRSPNAGWPESALAGSIGVRLSGPRSYAGQLDDEPWLNGRCPDPDAVSVSEGLKLYSAAMALLAASLLLIGCAAMYL